MEWLTNVVCALSLIISNNSYNQKVAAVANKMRQSYYIKQALNQLKL